MFEGTNGRMADRISGAGKLIKCMERDFLSGLMAGSTKAITSRIKSTDKGISNGPTEGSTQDNG